VVDAAKINLNLDTIEREKTYEPFTVVISGRPIVMTDPAELDWQVLMDVEVPSQFFRHVIADEDKATFRDANIPGWKLNELIKAYLGHYGLDKPGNAGGSQRF
jgi:hypothetical protein